MARLWNAYCKDLKNGLTFSPKKCNSHKQEIEYFGFVFTKDGINPPPPPPCKVCALKAMDPSRTATEVRLLLGMAQYSSRFIPNGSGRTQQKAFQQLKDALSSDAVLTYYEAGWLGAKLQDDAGPNGLGLILLQKKQQERKPVTCASKSITEVEKKSTPKLTGKPSQFVGHVKNATCT